MTTFHSTLAGLLLATTALATSAFAQEVPVAADAPVAASDQDQPSAIGDIVVLGRFIPEQNRRSPEVAAFLTAEDLQRTGDGTAAEALTRVTGLSIVEGRFVYVRGLGERYSSALLNGSPLPSPEPLQRVVPLDLFPSEILAGVTVQKTYSVAYPGEFGGGVIDLTTISAPSKPFFNFKSSLGVNSETTAREGLVYFGSRTDFTGFDDGTRDVPGPLRLAFQSGRRVVAGGGRGEGEGGGDGLGAGLAGADRHEVEDGEGDVVHLRMQPRRPLRHSLCGESRGGGERVGESGAGEAVADEPGGAVALFGQVAQHRAIFRRQSVPRRFAQEIVAGRRVLHVGEETVEGRGECHDSSFP